MARLSRDMAHQEIAEHLRQEVRQTAEYETGRLIAPDSPGFFGAVRSIISDVDYVAALYYGWNGRDRRRIGMAWKAIAYIMEVFPAATGDVAYALYAKHLYDMYRSGTVHLRAPKRLANPDASTPELTWGLMFERIGQEEYEGQVVNLTHLRLCPVNAQKTILPVSIRVLFEDFLASCELFARTVESEGAMGGTERRDRWRSTANVLTEAELSRLIW